MIYTLTLNPSLDVIYTIENYHFGEVNIISSKSAQPGGKGVNVSLMLRELGVPSIILGVIAGNIGQQIKNIIDKAGLKNDFVCLSNGESRVNLKFLTDGRMTEFNEIGPYIDKEIFRIYEKLDVLEKGDYLVISGRIHPAMNRNIYHDIMSYLEHRDINIIVDARADLLLPCLPLKPFLVKPNLDELVEIFSLSNQFIADLCDDDLKRLAFQLVEMGTQNAIISLGEKGAVLASDDGTFIKVAGFQGKQVSPVGAGDSLIAGFLAGYIETGDKRYSLELGSACGAATAFSLWLGTKDQIDELLAKSD